MSKSNEVISPVSVLRKQYSDAASTIQAIVNCETSLTNMFILLMSYIKALADSNKIKTPADVANFIRHHSGADFSPYHYDGELLQPIVGVKLRGLSYVSKTLANLVSMITREGVDLKKVVVAQSVQQLDDLTKKPVESNTNTVEQELSELTRKGLLAGTRKLAKSNPTFLSALDNLLREFGEIVEFEYTTKVVYTRK